MNYAGFGTRFLAFLIDGLILWVVDFILGLILGMVLSKDTVSWVGTAVGLLITVLYWVYYQHATGQTIGKKVMKIKVVDASGKMPTLLTFALREIIGKFISGLILGIGYLWMLWDPKKQCLHDKIASTYVVKV